MSLIDHALKANRKYAHHHDPKLAERPHADLDVIRTGGPAVTEDVLGELVVSTRIPGSRKKSRCGVLCST